MEKEFTNPFRLGKKQQRAILYSNGKELIVFPKGKELYALEYLNFLNSDIKKEYEDKIQKQNEILLKITGWDQPYNLTEILSRLVFATDYLLHVKDYDGHNHEELNQSIDRAKEILQFLETREAHFL